MKIFFIAAMLLATACCTSQEVDYRVTFYHRNGNVEVKMFDDIVRVNGGIYANGTLYLGDMTITPIYTTKK